MDEFTKQTAKTIGPGGCRCECCNPYRKKNRAGVGKIIPGLNKLRRSRLKTKLKKFLSKLF